jgi:head-tail adaptor
MFKNFRPDTAVRIKKDKDPNQKDADGFKIEDLTDVIDADLLVEWQNKFGSEVYKAAAVNAIEPASLRMWYIPEITPDCKIIRLSDNAVFEIIGLDDVMYRHQFLQIEVKRYVKGR